MYLNLLLGLYVGEILLTIGSDIISEIRYKKLKKDLGYVNIKAGELSECFSDSPILTILVIIAHYLLPFSFISSIKDNINFEYVSLDALKEELNDGTIKLKDEEELPPIELVHKIKETRKSLAAAYVDYLEELAKEQDPDQDFSANNVFIADPSKYEEKKEELKKLQLQFDSTMRHNYKTDDKS